MGILKNIKKRIFENDEEKEYRKLQATLLKEFYDFGHQAWYSIQVKDYQSFKDLKKRSDKFKVGYLKYIIEDVDETRYKIRKLRSNNDQSPWERNGVNNAVMKGLLRPKLDLSEEDIKYLFDRFRKSHIEGIGRFSDWPISYLSQQIEKRAKKETLSDEFIQYLREMLQWEQLKMVEQYGTSDIVKVQARIAKIINGSSTDSNQVAVITLTEDNLGTAINAEVEKMPEDLRNQWYSIFALLLKVSGGKPTAKFKKAIDPEINKIGKEVYKKQVHLWIDLYNSIEHSSQVHQYPQGTTTWTSYHFLESQNKVFIKGMVWSLIRFHDSLTLSKIAQLTERSFNTIPTLGPRAAGVGNAGIHVLAESKGLEGISHLSRIKLRIKQNNTKKLIDKKLTEQADKRGISLSEIEELSVPSFNLIQGKKEYSFKDYRFAIQVNGIGDVSSTWIKPDGSTQKSVPSFIKDSAPQKAQLAKARNEVKQIKKYLTAQRDRIDRLFIMDREWSTEDFKKYYIDHGLVWCITHKLILEFKVGKKWIPSYYNNENWLDIKSKKADIDSATSVRLWHPINHSTADIENWRKLIQEHQIKQAIKQAYREIYLLTDAEIKTRVYSNRMAAHILKQHQINALAAIRGWHYSLLGWYDDGRDEEIVKLKVSPEIEAQFWVDGINEEDQYNDAGILNYVATDQVRFVNPEGEGIDLIDIPKMVFSEAMRDVDLFVGVASVGNDPNWQDNGGMPRYRDYWQSYSFGDLTAVAKTRKGILENLLPRLKIRDVASIEGKFLIVKGTVRTYKIHIGSTNILMEPNDQYLCIVPGRGKDKNLNKVFLPFEGDRGFSILLSKAFLLAADDKIEDTTILSQIHPS